MTSLQGASLAADGFGEGAGERAELRQHFELVEEAFGGFDVEEAVMRLGDFVEVVDAESQGHAPLAAELVDEDLVAGMAFDVFKEECGAAGGVVPFCAGTRVRADFGDAVGDLGDFQLGRDFFADALELAVLFEGFDPVAQIVVGQRGAPAVLIERTSPIQTKAFGGLGHPDLGRRGSSGGGKRHVRRVQCPGAAKCEGRGQPAAHKKRAYSE